MKPKIFQKLLLFFTLLIVAILYTFLTRNPDTSSNTKHIKNTPNTNYSEIVNDPVTELSGIKGKVTKVTDGDTVTILPEGGGKAFICRLYGIDTPEISKKGKVGQPYSDEAGKELKGLIFGQDVKAILTGEKTYNREVCFIWHNGMDVNLEMVRRGYAWAYRQYLDRPHSSEYIKAEEAARVSRSGLWQQANPQPPWEFRHKK